MRREPQLFAVTEGLFGADAGSAVMPLVLAGPVRPRLPRVLQLHGLNVVVERLDRGRGRWRLLRAAAAGDEAAAVEDLGVEEGVALALGTHPAASFGGGDWGAWCSHTGITFRVAEDDQVAFGRACMEKKGVKILPR